MAAELLRAGFFCLRVWGLLQITTAPTAMSRIADERALCEVLGVENHLVRKNRGLHAIQQNSLGNPAPALQIEALHADKRGLDKVLAQRQGELDEMYARMQASMVRGQVVKTLVTSVLCCLQCMRIRRRDRHFFRIKPL